MAIRTTQLFTALNQPMKNCVSYIGTLRDFLDHFAPIGPSPSSLSWSIIREKKRCIKWKSSTCSSSTATPAPGVHHCTSFFTISRALSDVLIGWEIDFPCDTDRQTEGTNQPKQAKDWRNVFYPHTTPQPLLSIILWTNASGQNRSPFFYLLRRRSIRHKNASFRCCRVWEIKGSDLYTCQKSTMAVGRGGLMRAVDEIRSGRSNFLLSGH